MAENKSQQNGFTTPPGSVPASPSKPSSESGTPRAKRGSKSDVSRVRVFVRVRPAVRKNELEAADGDKGATSAIHCQGAKLWLLEDGGGEKEKKAGTRQFVFDGSLAPDSTQEDVYRASCEETDVVSAALEGINGCVMCYGQTGAGKTHTLGNVNAGSEGIVWRALSQILASAPTGGATEVRLYYIQIYMEQIYDLLDPASSVDLREDPKEGVVLSGASSVLLTDVDHAVATIDQANRNRVTSATAMNDTSSRSHSVLILDVTTRAGSKLLRGKLHLVDLAGSERVKKSEVTGQAFEEAVAINNSLTTLGRCVQALAAGPKGGKPPFRDTKLTRLLSSAFGGNAKTVLLVCVAPTSSDSFETVNSLQFGQQAMSVKVQAKVNATVDYAALEEELWWKVYESSIPRSRAEMAAWAAVRPVYESQQAMRIRVAKEVEQVESVKLELESLQQAQAHAKAEASGKLARRQKEHDRTMKAMRKQQAASAAELERLRALASSAGVAMPERAPEAAAAATAAADAPTAAATEGVVDGEAGEREAEDAAAQFGSKRVSGLKTLDGVGSNDMAALEAAAMRAVAGGKDEVEENKEELEQTVGAYQNAVERAWADVQRLEDERQQVSSLEKASEEEAIRLEREREDMEATLHEVASDLGRLALLYRTQGKAPHAVPLYMTALAIYEKTLGPEHPEVAKDLVNLGNAFCDQNQHSDAVPLYLRALAIDQAALGDDHPEVAIAPTSPDLA